MFKPIIGLEIHIELKTKRKMFCQCLADFFGKKPNSQVCPVCLGLPGALPVPNKKAIEWTILIGKALNCKINKITRFDRKHYFYPDLPKGYQISQYEEPIAVDGVLEIYKEDENKINKKKFRIRRVHLEEDTGKLFHTATETLIDFNRSGVPLVEIVTEPDFENSDDVKRFLEELQVIIRYLGVSDVDMEKGSMRLEPNISVIKINKTKSTRQQLPNYKVEIKNINSFRFVKQAIDYEINRQIQILKKEQIPIQETRGFDEKKGITYSQRTKEFAHDYRYFPEPDIPPIKIDQKWLTEIVKDMPELPNQKLLRYVNTLGLRFSDAYILTRNFKQTIFFENVLIEAINYEKKLRQKKEKIGQFIANLIINKKIPITVSVKEFILKMIELLSPKEVDEKVLEEVISKVIKNNQKAIKDYKRGKENVLMFLVGQVMKEMKGKVEPKIVIEKLKAKLIN